MSLQDAFIDVIGGLRVSATSRRHRGSPQGRPDACLGGGETLRCDGGRKDRSLENAAAQSQERRRARRHCQRLALAMSVFNQGAVFEAQMVNYGHGGICAETGHPVLPGTSIHVRMDARQAAEVGNIVLQGLRTTSLGEVKWCRAIGQCQSPRYRIGIRYYSYY
jgi:hypothetical protein